MSILDIVAGIIVAVVFIGILMSLGHAPTTMLYGDSTVDAPDPKDEN